LKFLVDNALSPNVSEHLQEASYDSVHVRDVDLQGVDDVSIFEYAADQDRVIVSADTDFSFLLSQRETTSPSLILFRGNTTRNPRKQAELLKENLGAIEDELRSGCVASIYPSRIRIRELPIFGKE